MGIPIDHLVNIEQIQKKVLDLITQCIEEIQRTVTTSDLQLRDVGVGIEMYKTNTGSNIIELRFSNN